MQQTVENLRDVHLLLTPLTFEQFMARSNQPGSTLPPINLTSALLAKTESSAVLLTAGNSIGGGDRQDFNNSVQHLFFPAKSGVGAQQHVDFPVFDDVVDEYNAELFIIVLDVDRNLTDVPVGFIPNLRTTLGTIVDDDC